MIRAALCLAAATVFGSAAFGQCTYKVTYDATYSTVVVALEAQYQAGIATLYVNTTPSCSWGATSNTSWLRITAGSQGAGNSPVTFTADQNTGASRVGSVVIAGQTITITQNALLGPAGVVYEGAISKSSGAQGSICNVTVSNGSANLPASTTVFAPTDAEVFLTFVMQNLNVGDQVTSQYYTPSGTLYSGAGAAYPTSNNLTSGGFTPECDSPASGLKIFGAPPANMPGAWRVDLLLNGTLILEIPFTITGTNTCSYSLSGNTNSFNASGGSGSIAVTANPGCPWNAVTSTPWIHLGSSGISGSGSGTVPYTVDVNTGATRNGSIVIAGQTFTITQAAAGGPAPSITQGGIAEPWTNSTGLAPGAWVSIYGNNLAPLTLTWSPVSGQPLPTSLGGVSVTIDGQPAPPSFVSPSQINVLVPSAVRLGPIQIVVNNNGSVSSGYSTQSTTYLPAIYARFSPGSSPAKYYVTAVNPVTGQIVGNFSADPSVVRAPRAGETIDLYGLGLGPASQFPTSTAFSGAFPLSATVSVTLGGTQITPSFAALVGPGLYQVRITLPVSIPLGDQPISLTVGGVAQTPPNVFLSIGQ